MTRIILVAVLCLIGNAVCFGQSQDADNDGLPRDWEEANGLNPNLATDAPADFDADGVNNLLEYLWGGNPRQADPEIKPAGTVQNEQFTISFNRRRSASSFVLEMEQADALGNGTWTTNGFTEVSRISTGPDLERVTYRLNAAVNQRPRQFVRVSARRVSVGQSMPEFSYHVIDDTVIHGQGLTVIDIDGDQDQDVIAALSFTDSVYLYLNNGNGSAWSRVKVAPDNSIVAMQTTVADFDSDGDLDIAAAAYFDRSCTFCSPGEIVWYANPGTNGLAWTERPIVSSLWGARYVSAGDLDQDGMTDVVVSAVDVSGNGRGVYWVRNAGNGTRWSEPLSVDANLRPVEKAIAYDLDGDLVEDIVALSKTDNLIVWYENDRVVNNAPGAPVFTRHVIASLTTPDFFQPANLDAEIGRAHV